MATSSICSRRSPKKPSRSSANRERGAAHASRPHDYPDPAGEPGRSSSSPESDRAPTSPGCPPSRTSRTLARSESLGSRFYSLPDGAAAPALAAPRASSPTRNRPCSARNSRPSRPFVRRRRPQLQGEACCAGFGAVESAMFYETSSDVVGSSAVGTAQVRSELDRSDPSSRWWQSGSGRRLLGVGSTLSKRATCLTPAWLLLRSAASRRTASNGPGAFDGGASAANQVRCVRGRSELLGPCNAIAGTSRAGADS